MKQPQIKIVITNSVIIKSVIGAKTINDTQVFKNPFSKEIINVLSLDSCKYTCLSPISFYKKITP